MIASYYTAKYGTGGRFRYTHSHHRDPGDAQDAILAFVRGGGNGVTDGLTGWVVTARGETLYEIKHADLITAGIGMTAQARYGRDTEALAVVIEGLVRAVTVGDRDLDSSYVRRERRGGIVKFRATVTDTRDGIIARLRQAAAAIDTNANLIDRIDAYTISAAADATVIGFCQGDYRGWLRENALADLAEAQS